MGWPDPWPIKIKESNKGRNKDQWDGGTKLRYELTGGGQDLKNRVYRDLIEAKNK